MKIIYYYQTLIGLKSILEEETPSCTHIILSSIHFGNNPDGSPYIHLNDHVPDDSIFDECWKELKILSDRGVTVMVMMGGAGGAYGDLFSNYNTYYGLLKNMISKPKKVKKNIDIDRLKIAVREITKEDIFSRNLNKKTTGVIITDISSRSPLSNLLSINDIIIEVQKTPVKNSSDLKRKVEGIFNKGEKTLLLTIINKDNRRRYLGVKIN